MGAVGSGSWVPDTTKFASGNNETLLEVFRNTGYLGKKLIGIWDIWGEN